jgi:hypothetical protein
MHGVTNTNRTEIINRILQVANCNNYDIDDGDGGVTKTKIMYQASPTSFQPKKVSNDAN